MTLLKAYVMLWTNGDWATSIHRDVEGIVQVWDRALKEDESACCVVHVGFWRPHLSAFVDVASCYPGRLLFTASALYALPQPVHATADPIALVGAIPIHLILSGWGYVIESPAASSRPLSGLDGFASTARMTDRGGWVAEAAKLDPSIDSALVQAGIADDPSYLAAEGHLEPAIRQQLSSLRFLILAGVPLSSSSLLEHLDCCPDWLLEMSVDDLALETRPMNVFRVYGIRTVRDIGSVDLLGLSNLGRKSIRQIGERLVDVLTAGPSRSGALVEREPESGVALQGSKPGYQLAGESFGQMIEVELSRLPDSMSRVLRMRMGVKGRLQTLQEVGDQIGVTRERIRRIESKALSRIERSPLWRMLEARLLTLLDGRADALPLVALDLLDPWFQDIAAYKAPLEYALDKLLDGRISILTANGQSFVSQLTQQRWDAAVIEGRDILEAHAGKGISEEDAKAMVYGIIIGAGEELKPELWAAVARWAHFAHIDGRRILIRYGWGAESIVETVLAEADRPLHYSEIEKIVSAAHGREIDPRRVHSAAANVGLLFGRGTYGLKKHYPLSSREAELLVAEAENLVLSGPSRKQWHSSEICDALEERGITFEDRLTPYTLNIALEDSKSLAYLGRMIWVTREAIQWNSDLRIDLRQAIIALIGSAGRPMTLYEIRAALAETRGLNETFQIQPEDPLIRVGSGLWGLIHRDMPFDIETADRIVGQMQDTLKERNIGLHASEIKQALATKEPMVALVEDPTFFLALAQRTTSMRVDRGQHVFLTEWGSSRRITPSEAVRLALAKNGDEGLSLAELLSEASRTTQRQLDKQTVRNALLQVANFDTATQRWRLSPEGDPSPKESA